MKIKKSYTNLLLLILGFFSLQAVEFDFFSNPQFFLEIELEESLTDIDELDFSKELSRADHGKDGSAVFFNTHLNLKNLSYSEVSSFYLNKKDSYRERYLFILYCCLKLDC